MTEINCKIIMKEIDPIAGIDHGATIKIGRKTIDCKIIMKGIGPITEINCTVETGTTSENTKDTIHIVEIGHEAIIGISETRGIKEGIEIIVQTSVKMGIQVIMMIVLEIDMTRVIIELVTKQG